MSLFDCVGSQASQIPVWLTLDTLGQLCGNHPWQCCHMHRDWHILGRKELVHLPPKLPRTTVDTSFSAKLPACHRKNHLLQWLLDPPFLYQPSGTWSGQHSQTWLTQLSGKASFLSWMISHQRASILRSICAHRTQQERRTIEPKWLSWNQSCQRKSIHLPHYQHRRWSDHLLVRNKCHQPSSASNRLAIQLRVGHNGQSSH